MFYKWGHFAYRHRRVIPVLVIALIAAMQVLFGSKLGERLSQEGWEDPGADSTAAAAIEQETFGRDNSGDVIVLVSSPEGVDRQELIDAARASFATEQPHLALAEFTAWKETATAIAAGLGDVETDWLDDSEPVERP